MGRVSVFRLSGNIKTFGSVLQKTYRYEMPNRKDVRSFAAGDKAELEPRLSWSLCAALDALGSVLKHLTHGGGCALKLIAQSTVYVQLANGAGVLA
jgi:hypothetical protein